MEGLNCDVQNIIYRYTHNLRYTDVVSELNKISDIWSCIYLRRRLAINKDILYYNNALNTFKDLNDYETALMRYFRFYDIDFLHYTPKLFYLQRHYL